MQVRTGRAAVRGRPSTATWHVPPTGQRSAEWPGGATGGRRGSQGAAPAAGLGELQGTYSPDELTEAIVELGPLSMGPPLVQLHDWATSTLQKTGRKRLTCRIVWARGELKSTDVVGATA